MKAQHKHYSSEMYILRRDRLLPLQLIQNILEIDFVVWEVNHMNRKMDVHASLFLHFIY
jgi:hypothetical protein